MDPRLLAQVLQASIAPCVLISAFGLLLLCMVNRLGRPIDRIRILCHELETRPGLERPALERQIAVLHRRCELLRLAIALCVLGVGGIAALILALFLQVAGENSLPYLAEVLFLGGMLCLLGSLAAFFMDVSLTLASIRMEMKRH